MKKVAEINNQFNLELWKHLKCYALTIECFDITHLFLKSGVDGDKSMLKEKVFEGQRFSGGDNAEKFLESFIPQYSNQTFGDMLISLTPKVETSLYSITAKNLMVNICDVFNNFLNDISVDLIESNPSLFFSSDDAKITSSFGSLKDNKDVEKVFTGYRISKLRELNFYSKLSFLENGFDTKFEIADDDIRKLLYWEQLVRVIQNNQSLIDQSMLSILQNQNQSYEFELGDIVPVSLNDVFDLATTISKLRIEVYYKITGEQPIRLESDPFKSDDPSIAEFYLKNHPHVNTEKKIGRNDPCPCGSGKKYKHCCIV